MPQAIERLGGRPARDRLLLSRESACYSGITRSPPAIELAPNRSRTSRPQRTTAPAGALRLAYLSQPDPPGPDRMPRVGVRVPPPASVFVLQSGSFRRFEARPEQPGVVLLAPGCRADEDTRPRSCPNACRTAACSTTVGYASTPPNGAKGACSADHASGSRGSAVMAARSAPSKVCPRCRCSPRGTAASAAAA